MIIGIDISLRSTGICFIDENKQLLNFKIIKSIPNNEKGNKNKPFPVLNREDLIIYNSKEVVKFVSECMDKYALEGIGCEGLSFSGISGSKDLIDGNFWGILVELRKKFPMIPVGSIPVTSWRNFYTTKEERKAAKEKYGKKYLKQMIVDKLPKDVLQKFEEYVKVNKIGKDGIFDLADSYFISCYRLKLEDE